MPFPQGAWVVHNGQTAVIAERKSDRIALIHYIDSNGETVMREAAPHEVACPQTGNPRTHVTHEVYVTDDELRPAREQEIPESRRPQEDEA